MTERLTLQVAAISDQGMRRDSNEDSVSWMDEGEGANLATLLVVADGIGDAASGEVASREAIDQLQQEVSGYLAAGNILGRLRAAIERANRHVYRLAESEEAYHGMGTTLSAAVITRNKLYVAHVGDSRVYLIRDGEAMQVSSDHTWIADEVESGRMTIDEAAHHPARKAINRGIGISASVHADTYGPLQLLEGDVVLLCTDGLSDLVEDDEIAQLVSAHEPVEGLPELVRLANSRGGPDNVSIVAARLAPEPEFAATPDRPIFDGLADGDAGLPVTRSRPAGGFSFQPAVWLPLAAVGVAAVLAIVMLTNGDGSNSQTDVAGAVSTPAVTAQAVAATPGVTSATATPAASGLGLAQCGDGSPAVGYTVATGDSLSVIADRYGVGLSALETCNPDVNPLLLQKGQPVNIPCGDRACSEVAAAGHP
jgi:serine/threonine protein phosphatase PrpC/LysM repeat protein